jgi:hypothetical protein
VDEDIEGRDESTPQGRHVKSSDGLPTQDDPEVLHLADDVSPVAKSQDPSVNVLDSSGVSERYRFCPSCGTEAVTGASFCSECGRSLIKTVNQSETVGSLGRSEEPVTTGASDEGTEAVTFSCLRCGTWGPIQSDTTTCKCRQCRWQHEFAQCPSCGITQLCKFDQRTTCRSCHAKFRPTAEHASTAELALADGDPHVTQTGSDDPSIPVEEQEDDPRSRWGSEVPPGHPFRTALLIVLAVLLLAVGVIFAVPKLRDNTPGVKSLFSSSNTGTSGTPEQQFANDAMGIQTVLSAVNNGTLTRAQIGSYGDSICNLMPQRLNQYGPGPSAFNSIANEFYEGLTHFRISGTDDGKWVALAITDICPAYVTDIPAGVTP